MLILPLETNQRHLRLEQMEAALRRRLHRLQERQVGKLAASRIGSMDLTAGVCTRLRLIEHALAQLNRGLGDCCEQCGRPIEPELLEAVPYRTRCAACSGDAAA